MTAKPIPEICALGWKGAQRPAQRTLVDEHARICSEAREGEADVLVQLHDLSNRARVLQLRRRLLLHPWRPVERASDAERTPGTHRVGQSRCSGKVLDKCTHASPGTTKFDTCNLK